MRPRRRELIAGIAAAPLVAIAPARASPRPRAQLAGTAAAASPDTELLERLLALELRLEAAYRAALERDAIEPALGRALLAHERDHVRGLELALRGGGRRDPRATAPPPELGAALANRRSFARFALALEERTIAAYEEALADLSRDGLLQPLGSIMAAGAQHAVALRQVLGQDLL